MGRLVLGEVVSQHRNRDRSVDALRSARALDKGAIVVWYPRVDRGTTIAIDRPDWIGPDWTR
jgi:hypothetical protein